ncbi:17646_t:CDS:2, partial [Acaulospora colombiana]
MGGATVKTQYYNNAIAIGAVSASIALGLLFITGIFIRRRRRNAKVEPESRSWKALEDPSTDFNPSLKSNATSYISNSFL